MAMATAAIVLALSMSSQNYFCGRPNCTWCAYWTV